MAGYDFALKDFDQALVSANRALSLTRDQEAQIKSKLLIANCLLELGNFAQAEQLFRQLWETDGQAAAISKLALIGKIRGDNSSAERLLSLGLEQFPETIDIHTEMAYLRLANGDFRNAWELYRFQNFARYGRALNPQHGAYWEGESLKDKQCLVWINQGLGDQLIFSRFLSLIKYEAKSLVAVCDSRCISLFEELYPGILFLPSTDASVTVPRLSVMQFDFQFFAEDIPSRFSGTKAENKVFSTLKLKTTDLLPDREGLKVGICWRSTFRASPKSLDRWTLDAQSLELLASLSDIQWGDLQHGNSQDFTEEELRYKQGLTQNLSRSPNGPILDFLYFIKSLDLILSIDSSVAVFAAMLGKRVWVLCPLDPFWFWTSNELFNWFPNVRTFRKSSDEPWSEFIEKTILPELRELRGSQNFGDLE